MEWSGPLYTYLVTAGYTFLYSSYGNDKNGYMGVGVAVPTDRFELLNADISRLADTVQWPRVNAAASGGMDSSDELLGSASTDEDGEAESSDFTSMDEDGPSSTSQDEASISEQLRKGRRRMSRKEKKLAKKVMEGKVQLGLGGRNRTPHRLSSALDAINISVSLNRKNCIVSAKLRCRRTDIAFGVSTYHMPCAFKKEAVMMVHAALAFQHAHRSEL